MMKRFAFMERFEIPAFDEPDVNYLTRWRVIQTPWFALYLHKIERPDSRPILHDHPWSFLSIVLRGGYDERRLDPKTMTTRRRTVRHVNLVRPHDAHYIERLHRPVVWTFLFVGPRVRTWGYWEGRDVDSELFHGEWLWTEHDKHRFAEEFDAALAARGTVDR